LGNGAAADSPTPVAVTGMESGVTAIAAGGLHNCAIQGGILKCWGKNNDGQLGNEGTTNSSTPVVVIGMDGGIAAISAGNKHTCAVQGDVLKCWGANNDGQLGNGTTTGSSTPGAVSGMKRHWWSQGSDGTTTIAAAFMHTCALQGGSLKCWGANLLGQLGDGSTDDSSTPVAVSGMKSGVTAVATGHNYTCAIRQ